MPLEILTLNNQKIWKNKINALCQNVRDLHYLPEYCEIYSRTYDVEPFCVYFSHNKQFLIQVFLKKPINRLSFVKTKDLDGQYYDLSNPYGYGGPVFSAQGIEEKKTLFIEYRRAFSKYCQQEHIVTEFASIHPLLESPEIFTQIPDFEVQTSKNIIYVDLNKTNQSLKHSLSRGTKSNINKATRLGVSVEWAPPTSTTINEFKKIYYSTMKRKGASHRWVFPDDYFDNCVSGLGEERVSFFFAKVGTKIAAAYMLIHDYNICYYHFGGSDPTFSQYRANNLLMYKTILYSKEKGFKYYHLGGGVTSSDDDKLLLYKKGFSPDMISLSSYKIIHNIEIYNKLCKIANVSKKSMEYFPAYRQKEG